MPVYLERRTGLDAKNCDQFIVLVHLRTSCSGGVGLLSHHFLFITGVVVNFVLETYRIQLFIVML